MKWRALKNTILILCFLVASCTYGNVYVKSDPEGAKVYQKDKRGIFGWSGHELKGTTPVEFERSGYAVSAYMVEWPDGSQSEWQEAAGKDLGDDYQLFFIKKSMSDALYLPMQPSIKSQITPYPTQQEPRQPPLIEAVKSTGQQVKWAVIIGVSKYNDSRITTLRYAHADAKSFYEWAVSPVGGRFAPSRVKLLLDEQATSRHIREALFEWLKQALAEDVVTIYFAGHGSPDSPDQQDNLFLLPFDADYDKIATTAFPMWDIETALKRFIKAKKVVVIADACHSGGIGQSYDTALRANRGIEVNPINSALQNLSKIGDGVCVISASDYSQYSQEGAGWGGGHGVFTYYLLQGLAGDADYSKDGAVTLGELIPYLSEQVRRATKSAQSPTVAGKFDPAMTIGN